MLTVEWQPLGTALGYDLPELVAEAGLGRPFAESLARSAELLRGAWRRAFARPGRLRRRPAYRIRYVMQMNAREAMHLLELRSGPQGHPAYRRVAQADAPRHRRGGRAPGHRRRHGPRRPRRGATSSASRPSGGPKPGGTQRARGNSATP